MKYLKIFENFSYYMYGNDILMINNIYDYLGMDTWIMDESIPDSIYNIDVMKFFEEIFMNKNIIFQSINKILSYPTIKGTVVDIDHFSYKMGFYIKVKLKNSQIMINNQFVDYKETDDDDWFLIKNNNIVTISDYDAKDKPLHKEVKLKKKAEKYNL